MTSIFISYAHKDKRKIRKLASLLDDLVYEADVWYDRELTVGKPSWWKEILGEIRERDIFVFMLSPDSVASIYCLAEFEYALALNKPILPVMVKHAAMPTAELSARQYADATNLRNPEAVTQIGRAYDFLRAGIATGDFAMPDPLPAPPPLPKSTAKPKDFPPSILIGMIAVGVIVGIALGALVLISQDADTSADVRNSGPVSRVEIDGASLEFEQYEVTLSRYLACVRDGPCTPTSEMTQDGQLLEPSDEPEALNLPVTRVTLSQAQAFCEWIGRRVPTVSEWRWAAFADDSERLYPWGNTPPTESYAHLAYPNDTDFNPQIVGTTPDGVHNGIYDLIGNVSEWATNEGSYREGLAEASSGEAYVAGGDFTTPPPDEQADYMTVASIDLPVSIIGIRCVGDES